MELLTFTTSDAPEAATRTQRRSQWLVPMSILTSLLQRGGPSVAFSAIVYCVTTMRLKYQRSLGDTDFVPTERRMRASSSLNSEQAAGIVVPAEANAR